MKALFFVELSVCMFLCCTLLPNQHTGTINDVNTGTIYGKVICKKDTLKEEVVVELFKGDSVPNLKKSRSASDTAIARVTTKNLGYRFDSLDLGDYSLRVVQKGIVIGKNEGLALKTNHDSLNADITVVIFIQQTFFITTDNSQHIAINNFTINNTSIAPDTAGRYPAEIPGKDTLALVVEYVKNSLAQTLHARLVRNADGTYRIELEDGAASVLIAIEPDTSAGPAVGRIMGYSAHQNGQNAIGAKVVARNTKALVGASDIATVSGKGLRQCDSATTTAAGSFSIDSLDTGKYYIEVNDHDTAGALAQAEITKAKPVCSVPTIVLSGFGTIRGRVPDSLICSDSSYIRILELNRLVPVSTKGFFISERVPKAAYSLRLVCGRKVVSSKLDSIQLKVNSGDTAIPAGFGLNRAPAFTSKPAYMTDTMEADLLYRDTLHAFDADHDTLRFALIDSVKGLTLADSIVSWTPTVKDTGSHVIRVVVTDRNGGFDSLRLTIIVKPKSDQPPAFSSQPVTMQDTVFVGSVYLDTVHAADPEGDALTFAFLTGGAGIALRDSIIQWTPAESDTGSRTVKMTARDIKSALDTLAWTIHIRPKPNHPPVFISLPADMRDTITVGMTYFDTVHASDPDSDAVTFTFLDGGAGITLRDSIIQWSPATTDSGTRSVSMLARDGRGGLDTLAWTIRVEINHPPVFASIPANMRNKAAVGSIYLDTVNAADPDGDAVSFAVLVGPSGLALHDSIVQWTPAATDTGTRTVSVTARDGRGGLDTLTYMINCSAPPVITSPVSLMRSSVYTLYQYSDTVTAVDPAKGWLTFKIANAPSGFTIDSIKGIVQWTPTLAGAYQISVYIVNAASLSDTLTWSITVVDPPVHTAPTPAAPSGPVSGVPLKAYQFVTTPVKCSRNDPVQYLFDYGNGTTSGWHNSNADSISWPDYGIYKIKARTRCAVDTTIQSSFSDSFAIGILTLKGTTNVTLLDDCESGKNDVNRWNGYWYGWDDNPNGGNSLITNLSVIGDPEKSYVFKFTPNEGNPFGSANNCVRIDYMFGDRQPSKNGIAYSNEVGFGTSLSSDGSSHSLTGATAISCWAKANSPISVEFRLEIHTSTGLLLFYQTIVNYTTQWQKFTIAISSFIQPDWNTPKTPMDLSKITNIGWDISASIPSNPQTGTVWIDDLHVEGITWKP